MNEYFTRYQSANLSNEEIRRNFVVRKKEFEKVMSDIRRTKKGTSFQHYIFVGRRGSGKSTMLRRIQAEVADDKKLSRQYIVVNLSEEQAGIYKLYDLWDQVVRHLTEAGYTLKVDDWTDYETDLQAYSRHLYAAIHQCLKKAKRRMILMIDNIDRVFRNIGNDANLLREQLMNHKDVWIIGGSTVMAEDFWRYDKAFYEFFAIRSLPPLTIEEVNELLRHWSKEKKLPKIEEFIEKHPGKLQAIRMLTDGTPRTMHLFVEMLINRDDQKGFDFLRKIIDDATPVYQERLLNLSPQQQKIVVELSFFWEAVGVEELIPVCKMKGRTISAQLNALAKSGIVEKVQGETKNLFYRLEERFFNMWLLMTQGGPKQKKEAKYLTVFLENWYEPDEIEELHTSFLVQLANGSIRKDYVLSMTNAFAHSRFISIADRDELIRIANDFLNSETELRNEVPEYAKEIFSDALQFLVAGNTESAIKRLKSVPQDDWLIERLVDGFQIYHEGVEILLEEFDLEFERIFNRHLVLLHYFMGIRHKRCIELLTKAIEGQNVPLKTKADDAIRWLWLGEIEAFKVGTDEIFKCLLGEEKLTELREYILSLWIHKQFEYIRTKFEDSEFAEKLQSMFRPIYYCILIKNAQNKGRTDLTIPPEIKDNVMEIFGFVLARQKFYYG